MHLTSPTPSPPTPEVPIFPRQVWLERRIPVHNFLLLKQATFRGHGQLYRVTSIQTSAATVGHGTRQCQSTEEKSHRRNKLQPKP